MNIQRKKRTFYDMLEPIAFRLFANDYNLFRITNTNDISERQLFQATLQWNNLDLDIQNKYYATAEIIHNKYNE